MKRLFQFLLAHLVFVYQFSGGGRRGCCYKIGLPSRGNGRSRALARLCVCVVGRGQVGGGGGDKYSCVTAVSKFAATKISS